MSHRLQVLLEEEEFRALRAAARARDITISDFVREALREAWAGDPSRTVEAKLAVVREAARYAWPIGDMEQIESEIVAGYLMDGGDEGQGG